MKASASLVRTASKPSWRAPTTSTPSGALISVVWVIGVLGPCSRSCCCPAGFIGLSRGTWTPLASIVRERWIKVRMMRASSIVLGVHDREVYIASNPVDRNPALIWPSFAESPRRRPVDQGLDDLPRTSYSCSSSRRSMTNEANDRRTDLIMPILARASRMTVDFRSTRTCASATEQDRTGTNGARRQCLASNRPTPSKPNHLRPLIPCQTLEIRPHRAQQTIHP